MDISMTETATFVPKADPQRRLVAAIGAIALLCVGLWWSGAVGPRLAVAVVSVEVEADAATGRGTIHLELRNHGALPVHVRGVTVDDRGGPPVDVGPARIGGRQLAAGGVHLSADSALRLEVPFTADCNRPAGYGADPVIVVRVRAPLGVTQARPAGTDALHDLRSHGDDSLDTGPLLCPSPGALRATAPSRSPD